MDFVEVKEKARLSQVFIDEAATIAVSEIANSFGVSRNAVLATAIHSWLIQFAKDGFSGDGLNFFVQKFERRNREDAFNEAVAIATELSEHPDAERQAAILQRICQDYGFDIESVIRKSELASRSAEYVRQTTTRQADARENFLIGLLMPIGTEMSVAEIEVRWREAGYPPTALNRVKRGLGIKSIRLPDGWAWKLKEKEEQQVHSDI